MPRKACVVLANCPRPVIQQGNYRVWGVCWVENKSVPFYFWAKIIDGYIRVGDKRHG